AAAVYLKDCSGRYISANPAFDSIFRACASASQNPLASGEEEALRRGVAVYGEHDLSSTSGTQRVLSVAIPLLRADGARCGVLGILMDCSGRYEENGIQLGEMHLLQSVLHSMQDGVIVLDAAGRCLFSNAAARTLLGNSIASNPLNQWVSELGL